MRDLRVGVLGRITAGREAGRIVEVIDDAENTGGYLIFTYADVDRSPEVFDAWVQSIIDVELYFDDSGWEVEWMDSRAAPYLPVRLGSSLFAVLDACWVEVAIDGQRGWI